VPAPAVSAERNETATACDGSGTTAAYGRRTTKHAPGPDRCHPDLEHDVLASEAR